MKKNPKWFYLILLLLPVIFIAALELFLNIVDYGNDYRTFIKLSDRFKAHKFFNPKLPQKYFGNSLISPSVIPDGFLEEKPKSTFRIFALGGSTTAGFPYSPNGSFPRLFKNLLEKRYPSLNFEVINLGISAVNTVTIRDIISDVIQEEPDLILFYAGHNEYYGAFGPASNVSIVNNQIVTRIILKMKEFRTFQLVENSISYIASVFQKPQVGDKTLMSKMAGEKLVPLNSELYYDGIEQFKSNLEYILDLLRENGIPVIVGTLASNLMQAPLCKYSGCDSLVTEFDSTIIGDISFEKLSLTKIKEKDGLRFRAPEKFNEVIKNYAEQYDCKLLDLQRIFEINSPNGIIGDNLMTDHLHPNFVGNKIIADSLLKLFIKDDNFLDLTVNKSEVPKSFNFDFEFSTFTELDSVLAAKKIQYLKSNFPFSEKGILKPLLYNSDNKIIEALAQKIIEGKLSWTDAHTKLADYNLKNGNFRKYLEELNVLIEDKPFDKYPYLKVIKTIEKSGEVETLKYFLHKYYDYFPDYFSALKLGNIYFSQRMHKEAIYFYSHSLLFNNRTPKIFFNLSASYYELKDIPNAIKNIQICLKFDPDYPNARKIYSALQKMYSSIAK